MRYLIWLVILFWLLAFAFAQEHPRVFILAPVIHSEDAYTAVCVTNKTMTWAGESASFQPTEIDIFLLEKGIIVTGKRISMQPAETMYLSTGDLLGWRKFRGMIVIMTQGEVGGTGYVIWSGDQLVGEIEEMK